MTTGNAYLLAEQEVLALLEVDRMCPICYIHSLTFVGVSSKVALEAGEAAMTTEPTLLEEIVATTTSGAEGSSFDGFPTFTNPNEGASPSDFQVDPQGSLAAQADTPSKNRQKLFSVAIL